jgi:hypothetical protein
MPLILGDQQMIQLCSSLFWLGCMRNHGFKIQWKKVTLNNIKGEAFSRMANKRSNNLNPKQLPELHQKKMKSGHTPQTFG